MFPFRPRGGPSPRSKKYCGPQKRFFAQYVDNVEDVRDISGTSRFLSGGMGGITSQLSEYLLVVAGRLSVDLLEIGIYPIETLKTQMMSSTRTEGANRTLALVAKRVWALGGLKAYYRGLAVCNSFVRLVSRSITIGRPGRRIPARVAASQGVKRAAHMLSQIFCHRHEHV